MSQPRSLDRTVYCTRTAFATKIDGRENNGRFVLTASILLTTVLAALRNKITTRAGYVTLAQRNPYERAHITAL